MADMSKNEKIEEDLLPPFHLAEAYPDASSIFSVSLPSVEEIRDEALIVLDTNVLLIPYTINPKSLDDIKRTYARLIGEERLFVPAQVARANLLRTEQTKSENCFSSFQESVIS